MIANPEIEVFYDEDCPVCNWEVRLYRRMDKSGHIRWTGIGNLLTSDLPAGKTREDLLGRFHVRDLDEREASNSMAQPWHIGVDAFDRIWRVLPVFRYFAFLFSFPVIRQLTMFAYRIFLKWQSWHRRRR